MGEVDIETFTMEQYLALDHGDIRRGVRRPEIERNVDFEIKCQFLRELRDNTFSGNKNEDAHEHVGRILEIATTRDLVIIQEMADHSHKWHEEEGDEMYCLSSEEVKCVKATLYREDNLMVTFGNNSPSGNSPKLEEILGKYLEESCKMRAIFEEWMKRFRENTDKNLRRHDSAIKASKKMLRDWLKRSKLIIN
ncbi:hypothetical protein Tco_1518064 [Tanacetum coccineum]